MCSSLVRVSIAGYVWRIATTKPATKARVRSTKEEIKHDPLTIMIQFVDLFRCNKHKNAMKLAININFRREGSFFFCIFQYDVFDCGAIDCSAALQIKYVRMFLYVFIRSA